MPFNNSLSIVEFKEEKGFCLTYLDQRSGLREIV